MNLLRAFVLGSCLVSLAGCHSHSRPLLFLPGPTDAPTTSVVASVTSLNFSTVGSQSTVSVTEPSFTGPFTAQSSDASIATVAAGSQPNSFIVTAGSIAGTATITVSGSSDSAPAVITVVLTLTQGVVH